MNFDELNKQSFIDKVKRGDPDALSDLVDKLAPILAGSIIRKILADFIEEHRILHEDAQEIAENIAIDTVNEAFRNINKFRGASKLTTWITSIAKNLARDYVRRHKKRVEKGLEASPGSIVSLDALGSASSGTTIPGIRRNKRKVVGTDTDQPEGEESEREVTLLIKAGLYALRSLSSDARSLIQMRYDLEWKPAQIASALGEKPSTVRVQIYRAEQAFMFHLIFYASSSPVLYAKLSGYAR